MGEFSKFEVVVFLFLVLVASTHADHDLKIGYYDDTCPDAIEIVRDYVVHHLPNGTPTAAASLLRLFFHDCFVNGCDGSVLLNSTKNSGKKTEKTSPINKSLKGFNIIDSVKSKLEKACPGAVSCADTLALATREAIYAIGGPYWEVPCGRKDGTLSNFIKPTDHDLPFPSDNLTTLETKFKNKGLNSTDLVLLSAAHTIGRSACTSFTTRLYNYTGKALNGKMNETDQDPALNGTYAIELKEKCPNISSTAKVFMDPGSNKNQFDTSYYKNVIQHMGLFVSDAALLTDSKTRSTIDQLLADASGENFKHRFAKAMVKMGNIDVKTGSDGEVRTNCAFVN